MKFSIVCFCFAAVAIVSAQDAKNVPNAFRAAFDRFKTQYGRAYASVEEENNRFGVFRENMNWMNQLNAKSTHKPYGVTKFMDMSRTEFAAKYLMKVNLTSVRAGGVQAPAPTPMALPTTFDWKAASKCVTAVKDQGQCGSCWAFSGVETIESVCCLAGQKLAILAEQQIVDCDTDGGVQGCDGGFPEDVYTYAQTFGGLDTEANYPYQAQDGTCVADTSNKYACPITSWQWVSQDASTENVMQQYLYQNSPLSIAADAESWQVYSGGVIDASSCGSDLDHAIQITGWTQMNGEAVWTVRNSWGADWGMNGYVYLQLGQNTCGVAEHVTVPCVTINGKTRC